MSEWIAFSIESSKIIANKDSIVYIKSHTQEAKDNGIYFDIALSGGQIDRFEFDDERDMYDKFKSIVNLIRHESASDLSFKEEEHKEPRRIPISYDYLLERVKSGKTMWVYDGGAMILITYFDIRQVQFCGDNENTYTYDYFTNTCWKFVDGTPLWKELYE